MPSDQAAQPPAPLADEPTPGAQPQVYTVKRGLHGWSFSRRAFLTAAATTVTAAGCSPDIPLIAGPTATPTSTPTPTPTPTPTATSTPTPTRTPTSTPTRTPTSTPTPRPAAAVDAPTLNMRSGPGPEYPVVGSYPADTQLEIVGKDASATWLKVLAPDGQEGWMAARYLRFDSALEALPTLATPPTPTPVGEPGEVQPGDTGINVTVGGERRTLPCGAPLPPGAVCTCNCVTVPACTCDGHCAVDTHYWYPN